MPKTTSRTETHSGRRFLARSDSNRKRASGRLLRRVPTRAGKSYEDSLKSILPRSGFTASSVSGETEEDELTKIMFLYLKRTNLEIDIKCSATDRILNRWWLWACYASSQNSILSASHRTRARCTNRRHIALSCPQMTELSSYSWSY